jgi:P-type conjugative transfer protein TrbJ
MNPLYSKAELSMPDRHESLLRIRFCRAAPICVALAIATPMHAQIPVTDAGALVQLVLQVKRQVQQVTMQTQQLKAQVDNMKKLGTYNGRQIAVTLQQIDGLTQQGLAIWYSLGAIDAEFKRTFPGWLVSDAFAPELRVQQERTLATLRSAINAASVTAQQLPVSNARLGAMKAQFGSITSAQQALELNGSVAIHAAEELTLLRQQLAAQGTAEAIALANQVNRETQGAAVNAAFDTSGRSNGPQRSRRPIDQIAF